MDDGRDDSVNLKKETESIYVDRVCDSSRVGNDMTVITYMSDTYSNLQKLGDEKIHEESYFNNMSDQDKCDKTYGALLSCYVREGLVDKSLAHVQKMKENGFSPNNCSYRICSNLYGTASDIENMEKLLEEMESEPYISMDWSTSTMVANLYIKAGINMKAIVALKKAEDEEEKVASLLYELRFKEVRVGEFLKRAYVEVAEGQEKEDAWKWYHKWKEKFPHLVGKVLKRGGYCYGPRQRMVRESE
ncbi:uncharacterized protein LOC131160990 [Malania oleifera]|uniref:uncharacterized protein LOC131160990 n=1 Tax=Malania oleifera TaxID=397392 RepID=UPI0025AE40D4|nr:uncharacterized protein LOC131160990 [Malania oleifera]